MAEITEPGVYDGMPPEEYQADPVPGGSLSVSGARKLLPPSCPALYKHWTTSSEPHKAEYDVGHVAHKLVLGVGPTVVVVDADNWTTKAARAQRDEAYAAGATPVLRKDHEQVRAMAASLRRHPVASKLFQPGTGKAEQSLFWQDHRIWRRARLDWIRDASAARLIVADYKTCLSAEPEHLSRAMHNFGYGQQGAWYLDAAKALGLAPNGEPAFVFVFQEKTPPYVVTVCEPDAETLRWGQVLNRKAIDVYRRCRESGVWPGYADEVISVGLPSWATYQHESAAARGLYEVST
jgi:PDDEXK-like domain of unknown function (DUF3799)